MHGLGGHSEKTWSTEVVQPVGRGRGWFDFMVGARIPALEETVFWPRDLLPQTVKNARIMTYGYDADVSSATEHVNIFQHSRDLLIALTAQRRDNVCSHHHSARILALNYD